MIHVPPLLLSADFDPFQAAIIVIALIGGFVKWLWESWQQRREAASPPPPDPEEQALREAAWRKQTGQSKQPPPLPPVAPAPWDELRKAWKELKDAARPASPPAPPYPVPQRRAANRPPPMPQQRQAQVQPPPATPAPVRTAPATPTAPPPSVARPVSPALAALHKLRHDPALMRQAILMQEILGVPKALREDSPLA